MKQVYEFTFRGAIEEDGKTRGNTYHVILEPNGPAMTPEAAAADGWTLPVIEADILRQVTAELDEVRAELGEKETALEEVTARAAKAERVVTVLGAQLTSAPATKAKK